ncbi:hypothetical protein DFP72DRAFT_1047598 [Ephemerocybe angulata]|uniref:Crinkler effector protein N-terminal domain-containing protein n=1 Tax=Ephemerocybe angulata TaxID=980116 RepID=A0A8H6HS16_9AGAR|nr:hypothetical protein DFP72DRAFT_1047598 [Tulosesus angulatus]
MPIMVVNCLVVGRSQTFSVEISKDATVLNLKMDIWEKLKFDGRVFRLVDIVLHKVSQSLEDAGRLQTRDLSLILREEGIALSEKLSDLFENPDSTCVLIFLPITLRCVIWGVEGFEGFEFPITIFAHKDISSLKQSIANETGLLNIRLFKPNLPLIADEGLSQTIATLRIEGQEEFSQNSSCAITNYFPADPPLDDIHVIVVPFNKLDEGMSSGVPMKRTESWYEKAWRVEYVGDAHANLLLNIGRSIPPYPAPYENIGAIIQSSGYGKSRTVDEMAALIPTIPMNVRDKEDSKQGAYPPPDEPLTTLFSAISMNSLNVDEAAQAFHSFFAILFEKLAEKVDKLAKGDLAIKLRADFANTESRSEFYQDVCQRFQQVIPHPESDHELRAKNALSNLIEKLPPPDKRSDNRLSLLLYVDEAHTLSNRRLRSAQYSLYDGMLKAVAEYSTQNFFLLVLSTSSHLDRFAPPARLANSMRQQRANLVAPFTEMPFDCHPKLRKRLKPDLNLSDIQQFEFIAQFGRPLWWTCFEGHQNQGTAVTKKLAASKLTCLDSVTSTVKLDSTAKLAILDTLLNLDYQPSRIQTRKLADKMVASYLRTAFSVANDREFMFTGYPSEPVLAEAALDIVEILDNQEADPMAALFGDLDQDSRAAIDLGQRGENVAKMILLNAYRASIKEGTKASHTDGFYPWRHGCSVVSFLRNLTAEGFWDVVLKSKPANMLKGAFFRGCVPGCLAWVAFVRGMALIGWHSQDQVDLHIPVLLDKDAPIRETNMSGILVQVKLRKKHSLRSEVAINAGALAYFPPPSGPRSEFPVPQAANTPRPYISVVMELGKTTEEQRHPPHIVGWLDKGGYPQDRKPFSPSIPKVIASNSPSTMHHPRPTTHPTYNLFFYGRSHKIYRCVPYASAQLYEDLLKIGSLLDAHPTGRSTNFVYELKPFWAAGTSCYNWVEDKFLNGNYKSDGAIDAVKAEEVVARDDGMDIEPAGVEGDVSDSMCIG